MKIANSNAEFIQQSIAAGTIRPDGAVVAAYTANHKNRQPLTNAEHAIGRVDAMVPVIGQLTARQKRQAAKIKATAKAELARAARENQYAALPEVERQAIVTALSDIGNDANQQAESFIDNLDDEINVALSEAVEKYGHDLILAAFENGDVDDAIVSTDCTFNLQKMVEQL